MIIQEMVNENNQTLFDAIAYFSPFEEEEKLSYWLEFISYFGQRTVRGLFENYFINNFELLHKFFEPLTKDWADRKAVLDRIALDYADLDKVVTERTLTQNDTGNTADGVNTWDNVETTLGTDTTGQDRSITETITTTKTGYNPDQFKYYKEVFKNSLNYRFLVYNDIVNLIALAIY